MYLVGYLRPGEATIKREIMFYRTTSVRLLNRKIQELEEGGVLYNTLVITGHNTSFKGF